jgi:hypothetical protein
LTLNAPTTVDRPDGSGIASAFFGVAFIGGGRACGQLPMWRAPVEQTLFVTSWRLSEFCVITLA